MSRLSVFLRARTRQLRGDRWYWSKTEHYSPEWEARAVAAAAMCADAKWVCDLGCGPQFLRRYLGQDVIYLPADLNQWTPDTEVCDLNSGKLPSQSLKLCDICVMMGLIGYLRDPKWLIRELAQYAEHVLISYFEGGQNLLSLDELFRTLHLSGFKKMTVESYGAWTMIKATNEQFDNLARLKRIIAREHWRRP